MTVDESAFPRIHELGGYTPTSCPDEFYNCIAWAAAVSDEWWAPGGVWPDNFPDDHSVESLIKVYEHHGFLRCEHGAVETGFDKLAIYSKNNIWQHAARQLADGQWTSKLGPDDDISHATVEALEGPAYGSVVQYMKRPVRDQPPTSPVTKG